VSAITTLIRFFSLAALVQPISIRTLFRAGTAAGRLVALEGCVQFKVIWFEKQAMVAVGNNKIEPKHS